MRRLDARKAALDWLDALTDQQLEDWYGPQCDLTADRVRTRFYSADNAEDETVESLLDEIENGATVRDAFADLGLLDGY